MYAGEIGSIRLLKLFEKLQIKTTWFIPGHSLDTFPDQMAAVRDAGHEMYVYVTPGSEHESVAEVMG